MKRVLTLILILLLPVSASAQTGPIHLLGPTTLQQASQPVKDAIKQLRITPASVERYPILKEKLPQIQALLEKLRIPEDGMNPIHFIISDSFQVNAAYIKVPNSSERIIMLNLGALEFVKTDDELAAILGHELEHGVSQLDEYVTQLAKQNHEVVKLLFRTVENEVDVKSLMRRLLKKGFNPYAQRDVLVRLQEQFGNIPNVTHTSTGSRVDSTDAAYAVAGRGKGEELNVASSNHIADEALHAQLGSDAVKQQQLLKIHALISSPSPQFEQEFIRIKGAHGVETKYFSSFEVVFNRKASELESHASSAFTSEEIFDLKMKLHDRMYHQLHDARVKILGKNPKKLSSRQAEAWLKEERILPYVSPDTLINSQVAIRKAEAEIKAIVSEGAAETDAGHSMILKLNQDIEKHKRTYELSRSAFEDGKKVDEFIEQEVQKTLQAKPQDNYVRNRWLKNQAKLTGPKQTAFDQEAKDYLAQHLDQKAHEFVSSSPVIEFNSVLDPDLNRDLDIKFGQTAREEWFRQYARGNEAERLRLVEKFFGSSHYIPMVLRDDPGFMQRFLGTITEHATTLTEMNAWTWPQQPYQPRFASIDSSNSFSDLAALYPAGAGEKFIAKRLMLAKKLIENPSPHESFYTLLEKLDTEVDGARSIFLNNPKLKMTPSVKAAFEDLLSHATEQLTRSTQGILAPEVIEDLMRYRYNDSLSHLGSVIDPPKMDPVTLFKKLEASNLPKKFAGAVRLESFFPYLKNPEVEQTITHVLQEHPHWFSRSSLVSTPESELEAFYKPFVQMLDHTLDHPEAFQHVGRYFNQRSGGFTLSGGDSGHLRKLEYAYQTKYMEHHFDKMGGDYSRKNINEFYSSLDRGGFEVKPVFRQEFFQKKNLDTSQKLKFITEYEKSVPNLKVSGFGNREISQLFNDSHFNVSPASLLKDPPKDPAEFAEWVRVMMEHGTAESARDELVQLALERLETQPAEYSDLRKILIHPDQVQKIQSPALRKELALWQLEKSFSLKKMGTEVKSGSIAAKNARKPVDGIRHIIEEQFPEVSFERNEVIDAVEKRILSTPLENAQLSKLRLNEENWVTLKGIHGVDGASSVNNLIKTNSDRLEVIKYLISPNATADELCKTLKLTPDAFNLQKLNFFKKQFVQSNIHARTFVLLPLLDETKGILSEPRIKHSLENLILGDKANDKLFKAILEAYLESVHPSDAKVILGHVLGSFVENKQALGKLSIKAVLEAMGPLGVRAGQFAYSSGLATGALAEELKDLLDKAMEPSRNKVIADIKRAFGEQLLSVETLDDVIGSGSINYGFKAKIKSPETGKIREIFLRVQRDGVVGQVANENEIWKKAIEKLKNSQDPRARRMASLIEELRVNGYSTLQEGGIELDHGIERKSYETANQIYSKSAQLTESGMEISPTRPIDEIQKMIPADLQSKISAYEYVDGTSWKHLMEADPQKAQRIAKDIASAELDAIFNGHFDADGHMGNWIVSPKSGKIVRADYAQIMQVGKAEVEEVKKAIKLLAEPFLTQRDLPRLQSAIKSMFEIKNGPSEIPLKSIHELAEKISVSGDDPFDRLFSLREELESILDKQGFDKVAVRLAPDARKMITALGKTRKIADLMGAEAYRSLLAKKLGFSLEEKFWIGWKRLKKTSLKAKVASVANTCSPVNLLKAVMKR